MVNFKLDELPLFKDLSLDEINHFINKTGAVIKNYSHGNRILKSYEPNSNIGILIQASCI